MAAPLLSDAAGALTLLTRLPLPLPHSAPRAGGCWAYPLAGMATGALAALAGTLAMALGLPAGGAAAVALATGAMATGGLHEDGLSDTADGLWGGWTRERRLEIMKDSRVGSFGVLALVLVTLMRWSAVAALLQAGQAAALIPAAMLSRAAMPVLMAWLPNARANGLSNAVGRPDWAVALAGLALGFGPALLWHGGLALGMLALAALVVALLGITARARIGGQTGDILGAGQQLAEAAILGLAAGAA